MNQFSSQKPRENSSTRSRYVGRPIRLPKRCAFPKGLVIVTTVTAILLVLSLMVLSVALIVGPGDAPVGNVGPGNSQGGAQDPSSQAPPSKISQKTGMKLPCMTTASTISYSKEGAKEISIPTATQAATLIDVTNGRVVAWKNGEEKIYPASMTKVMTLLVACENATDPEALLTVTEAMKTKYKKFSGASIANPWAVGDQVTVEDALHLVIYESDTYACWLLAEHIAGSEEAFVKMMNDRAAALGLGNSTHFQNCTGLYDDDHYTTCFDMAVIMAAAMKNESAKIVLTSYESYSVDVYVDGVKNSDKSFSMGTGWYADRLYPYRYPSTAAYYAGNGSDIRLIAGKTGYEDIPKYCFVTAGQHDESKTLYVCVQVGADSPRASTNASREIYQKYATE